MGTAYTDGDAIRFANIKPLHGGGALGVFVVKDGTTVRAVSKFSPDAVTWPGDADAVEVAELDLARPFTIVQGGVNASHEITITEPVSNLVFGSDDYGATWEAIA